jgi:hypothetical protein
MTMTPQDIERVNSIERYLHVVSRPGDLIEVRAWPDPSTGRTGVARGLFTNLRMAAITCVHMTNEGLQTYTSLNPLLPGTFYVKQAGLHRPFWRVSETARDHHIANRRLYLLEIDAVRPAQWSKHCATAQEKAEAWDQAQRLKQFLTERGWPQPITIDSGSGYHLVYCANGCSVSPEATQVLARALRYLKSLFPGLDAGVYNPARIARVPFTINRRGPETEDRPHRQARVISNPDSFEPVMPFKICELADSAGVLTDDDGKRISNRRIKNEGTLLIDEDGVGDLIDEYPDHLTLDGVRREGDITYLGLAECPFKGAAHRGQEIGAGKTFIILRPDSIGFHCYSSDCEGKTFTDLLYLLHSETGRWPETPIWEDDTEEVERRWGGVEDVSQRESYDQERVKAEYTKWVHLVDQALQKDNPGEQRGFREQINAIWKADDLGAMVEWLRDTVGLRFQHGGLV